ncbi:MAG: reverse transcriptase domain-containing protein [Neomegalonema sp.]|nr:reverse transcriptase domain-containing protein [Neomegalonema sp.]
MNDLKSAERSETEARFPKSFQSADELAAFLGVSKREMHREIYAADRYESFEIPKRTGGMRPIDSPSGLTREAQYKLLPMLIERHRPHPASHAFIEGRSVLTNARPHIGQRLVLNIDLEGFFPSINFGRIRGLFMANPFRMSAEAATLCAQICCYKNGLPQGAPTSPVLSNYIASALDRRLSRLSREHGLRYSRYADDITYSTSRDAFPEEIAIWSGEPANGPVVVGAAIVGAVDASGFKINNNKVRLQHRRVRQSVTGLTVNERPNVDRRRLSRIRAMIYAWGKFKLEGAAFAHFTKYSTKKPSNPAKYARQFRSKLYGELAYLKMVRGSEDPLFLSLCRKLHEVDPKPTRFLREVVHGKEACEVFISHASEDRKSVARPIYEACHKLGIKAFLDQEHIAWGEEFATKINTALAAAPVVLAIVSSHAVRKPWPRAEINTSLSLELAGKKSVVALMVGKPDLGPVQILEGKDYLIWDGDPEAVAQQLRAALDGAKKAQAVAAQKTERRGWFARLLGSDD